VPRGQLFRLWHNTKKMGNAEIWDLESLKKLVKELEEGKFADKVLIRGCIGSGSKSGKFNISAGERGISSQFVFYDKVFKDYKKSRDMKPLMNANVFILGFFDRKDISEEALKVLEERK